MYGRAGRRDVGGGQRGRVEPAREREGIDGARDRAPEIAVADAERGALVQLAVQLLDVPPGPGAVPLRLPEAQVPDRGGDCPAQPEWVGPGQAGVVEREGAEHQLVTGPSAIS
jgi:hypothetical protein